VLAVVLFLAWHGAVPLIFGYHAAAPNVRPKTVDFNNPKRLLAEADRFAWVFNSQEAGPLYARAEQLFAKTGDEANEIHACVGLIRARAETMSFVDISQFLATELKKPVVLNNSRLKLWVLAAKGYTDIEINPSAAKAEWKEAREIAGRLGEKQWVERADGELAIFGFLDGDSTRAAALIGSALVHAMMYGDAGGQIRFLEMIGNGLAQERRYENALYFFNRAMRIAKDTPDVGFPFMAYEGKADALLALGHAAEARALLLDALKTAQQLHKEGHQTQALMLLGELAEKVGDRKSAIDYLEHAAAIGTRLGFDRMVGQTMFDLARVYEEQGDSLDDVMGLLDDYKRYVDIYRPMVVKANLIEQTNDYEKVGLLMVQQALSVTGAVETDDEVTIAKVDEDRIYSLSTSVRVQEIADYGKPNQHALPEDQGPGYVWRTFNLTRLEQRDGGVYVELEMLALSRGIPALLRWLIQPLAERLPRNILQATLQDTRNAVTQEMKMTSLKTQRTAQVAATR